jgi:hypothetical protein
VSEANAAGDDRSAVTDGDGRRFRLASPRTAVVLGAVFAVLAVALVPLSLIARQDPLVNGPEAIGTIPFAAVGVIIARRQPRNPIGWLFLGIAGCLLLSVDSGFYSVISYRLGITCRWLRWRCSCTSCGVPACCCSHW